VVGEQRSSPRRARLPHAGRGRGGVLRWPRISPASTRWTGKQVGKKPRAIHLYPYPPTITRRLLPPPDVRRAPLKGKSAVVTGVSRRAGIGYAIACRLAAYGANVFCH